ncbi:CoA pyrophosphatase [Leptospira ognonensis]|uniref:CoA pyrophosphatase n=1 Tax=Leptospira ognonensis TaxID=2484945 RepID=A0A4R9JXT1_9LEPT|nr:CoA pyrophosphatase [Leptospira ognonensis]TGL56287.1 CoA pyrophosphatase [Leptospira ognonensis]
MNLDLKSVQGKLSQSWHSMPDTTKKISSVIIPIFELDDLGQGLILTQRAKHLNSHPGQISFPGGVLDPEDKDLLQCALREWEEEMGVSREQLTVLGKHEGMQTRTGFHITPFLGKYIGDFQFSHNEDEVEKIIILPFSKLLKAPFYSLQFTSRNGDDHSFYFDLEDGLLWGATCEMIIRLLNDYASFDRKPIQVQPNLNSPPFFDPKLI